MDLPLGISPWTAYTARVAVALLIVALLISILFVGAFLVVNYGLMSRREEDLHGGQEPSDPGFLQRERFKGARSHREYLPAEEGPEQYWAPERESTLSERQMLHEEDMPSDAPSEMVGRWAGSRAQKRAEKRVKRERRRAG